MQAPPPSLDAVVGLGSNLGDRRSTLAGAVRSLSNLGRVRSVSELYESKAVGPPQPDFLNAAVRLETNLDPARLLAGLLDIERAAGRVRRERWGPRVLDLDLLWVRGLALESPGLTVPHPELIRRAFALLPLLDVAPDALDPRTERPYHELGPSLGHSEIRRVSVRPASPAPPGGQDQKSTLAGAVDAPPARWYQPRAPGEEALAAREPERPPPRPKEPEN
jgi:2-amino-4-hydroxy-6-hydroxymethyldihydropteridine diphosphokinase